MIKITLEGKHGTGKRLMAQQIGNMLENKFKYQKNVDYMIFDKEAPKKKDFLYGRICLMAMIIVRQK